MQAFSAFSVVNSAKQSWPFELFSDFLCSPSLENKEALAEIYTIHCFALLSNPKKLVNNCQNWSTLCKTLLKFATFCHTFVQHLATFDNKLSTIQFGKLRVSLFFVVWVWFQFFFPRFFLLRIPSCAKGVHCVDLGESFPMRS